MCEFLVLGSWLLQGGLYVRVFCEVIVAVMVIAIVRGSGCIICVPHLCHMLAATCSRGCDPAFWCGNSLVCAKCYSLKIHLYTQSWSNESRLKVKLLFSIDTYIFTNMYIHMYIHSYIYAHTYKQMYIYMWERISRTTSTTLPNRIRLGPKVPS